jgi:putative transposase
VEIIDARIGEMTAKYSAAYPSAMKCLTTDRDRLTAYLRFPAEHHNRVRHSNFIERTFGETRRRTKVIGRLPGETSCLTLVWAVLDRASAGWRGFTMTAGGLRLLQDLRRSLLDPPRQLRPRTLTQPVDLHRIPDATLFFLLEAGWLLPVALDRSAARSRLAPG